MLPLFILKDLSAVHKWWAEEHNSWKDWHFHFAIVIWLTDPTEKYRRMALGAKLT